MDSRAEGGELVKRLFETIIGIDAGTTRSGFVRIERAYPKLAPAVLEAHVLPNEEIAARLRELSHPVTPESVKASRVLAVEQIVQSYGRPGVSLFTAVEWGGRFIEAWGRDFMHVTRPEAKRELVGRVNANDADVSAAIRSRYPGTGGGARPEVGTKAKPGPLFGVKADAWAALAVALTADRLLWLDELREHDDRRKDRRR